MLSSGDGSEVVEVVCKLYPTFPFVLWDDAFVGLLSLLGNDKRRLSFSLGDGEVRGETGLRLSFVVFVGRDEASGGGASGGGPSQPPLLGGEVTALLFSLGVT